ncbi:hypothetical protein ACIO14_06795 [Nocardia fluminea]|uniref:hypothetical protein n=1 Tax=Nocardia fluminea TaxID=134984 RepID=UPI00380BC91D
MLAGPHEQRLATAAAVDALLAEGWDIADPLPERSIGDGACTWFADRLQRVTARGAGLW